MEMEGELESESERRKSSAAGGNKRGRDDDREAAGRGLEKRHSGVINVMEEYSYSYRGDEMINGVKYEEEKEPSSPSTPTPTPGLLNQLITSVVNNQQEPDDSLIPTTTGGRGGVPEDDKGEQVAEVNEKDEKNATEDDAGAANIIDNFVARLPRTLSEDTAPATDEASILIHSIIHD